MNLWQREDLRRATGETLRPGGFELTRRGLALCGQLCGLKRHARVLDIGCGAGATLRLLEKEGYLAFGLDKSPPLSRTNGLVVRADLMRPPFAAATMDAVVSECVLSLMPFPLAALEEWSRVLRPGGALLLTEFYIRNSATARTCSAASNSPVSHVQNFFEDAPYTASPQNGSCLDGARPAAEWNVLLEQSGFFLHTFEDHSTGLAELAARIVWYGRSDLPGAFSLPPSAGGCRTRYGYGLWIAQKETPCTLS
ncbi:MAG: class I SAM-dependent methyltransferase [Desulfovibrio sp.]|jgi:SAM-dependent methyltransferase|nr:class I SAM-dependent methyltransferase [Desulfovibrio sp.]